MERPTGVGVEISVQSDVMILSFALEELDLEGGGMLKSRFSELVPEDCQALVFDISAVQYMDSEGLKAIAFCSEELLERGGRIAVVCVNQSLRVFRLTRLEESFPIFCDKDSAVSSLKI